jgi:hypothetical protein
MQTELNIWYLDDGSLGDEPDRALEAFKKIEVESKKMGLELNKDKCEVSVMAADQTTTSEIIQQFKHFAPGIRTFNEDHAELLGAPLTSESIRRVLRLKTEEFEKMRSRLSSLSSHTAFFLLRISISTPKLIYFLRCSPSFKEEGCLLQYDVALKSVLEEILNLSLTDEAWHQSSLPVKMGGLGVRHAVDTATHSFLASFHSCKNLVDQVLPSYLDSVDVNVVDATRDWTLEGHTIPNAADARTQSKWEVQKFTKLQATLINTSHDEVQKARILAASSPHSGDWLQALPSPQLGTLLSNESFRIASALRLGGDICQPHICPCGSAVAGSGHHGLSCKRSAGRLSRHAAVNDLIQRALRSAEIPSIKEPTGCSRTDGKKPDGLTLIPWKHGKALIWDFTSSCTFAPSYVRGCASSPGHAALLAEARKHGVYQDLESRFLFVPVAVETSGVWGREGLELMKTIGQRISAVTGERRASGYLLQRISIAIQRGNAACILGTLPAGKELDEIFYF